MTRYRMDRDLIMTHHPGYENEYYTISVPGLSLLGVAFRPCYVLLALADQSFSGAAPRRMTHEEAGKITAHAWDIFIDIDGKLGRNICPLPHAQLDNVRVARKEVEQVDKLSCKDRLDQIQHLLTLEEKGILSAVLVHISGGTLENSSLWDMIRSQSLLVNSSLNFGDIWTTYKLRQGQSALARAIFDEAIDFGLQYTFNTQVCSISDDKDNNLGSVTVTAANGESFSARRVVCTVPLNVLRTLHFSPPLSPKRQEAISIGHVNFMSKIHAVVDGPGLTSWNGMRLPGHLLFGYGDGITPNGDAHLVGFGADQRTSFVPEEQPEKVVAAFNALHQMKVKKTVSIIHCAEWLVTGVSMVMETPPLTESSQVFHNWCTDPYSSGGPAWWPPEFMSKYQDELQSSHGSVFFASGDWAHGWRASIDGALEQGSLCGIHVLRELHDADKLVEKVEASRL